MPPCIRGMKTSTKNAPPFFKISNLGKLPLLPSKDSMKSKNRTLFKKISRRNFLKTSAAISLTPALSNSRVFGANERINVALIGFGLIGQIHARSYKEQRDCPTPAVAEAYHPRLDAAADLIG